MYYLVRPPGEKQLGAHSRIVTARTMHGGTPHEYSVESLSVWSMRCLWHDRLSECLNLNPSLPIHHGIYLPVSSEGEFGNFAAGPGPYYLPSTCHRVAVTLDNASAVPSFPSGPPTGDIFIMPGWNNGDSLWPNPVS